MKFTPILLFLFASNFTFSQSSKSRFEIQLDSLKSDLKIAKNDSNRATLLANITSAFGRTNPDSTIFYGNKAIELAKNMDNKLIAVFVLGYIGDAYHSKGNLAKGIEVCLEGIAINKGRTSPKKSDAGTEYSTLGDIYTDLGNYRQALSMYNMLLEIPNSADACLGNAFGHFGRASVYEKMNMLDSSLYELEQSKINFSKSEGSFGGELYPKVYPVTPDWYNLRSSVYAKQGKINLALQDLKTTLDMTLRSGQSGYTANSFNDIAKLYADINSSDSAIYYAKKGFQEANRISYIGGILVASEILSKQYDSVNDTEALFYLKEANRMRDQLYSADNIQLMKDMIAQDEKKAEELKRAEETYQNKLKLYLLFSGLALLLLAAFFLYRNNLRKQKANNLLHQQKEEIDMQRAKAETALIELKSTQAQLIQSEKMASLGELTAGIAHEIQNPLNFVNNFSEVSEELVKEIKDERLKTKDQRDEALEDEILTDIEQNLQKIHHHGNRASSIVKGMLEHSRTSSGQKELIDINALADEYLRLSYHGLRAKNKDFNAEMITNFDPDLPKIEVIPQDIGRVLLNLINNAFQATSEEALKRKSNSDENEAKSDSYKPKVTITTSQELTANSQKRIAIKIKDNGPGIPEEIKDKVFQPFFTTKDTGKGTGLGLSLAYDIVKAHGGELKVETKEGLGSEFIIILPIAV